MGLQTYNQKRKFDKTPEPKGEKSQASGSSFVIQKHAARRLHYDFRLEMDGVLKSWAVTRGPSLDPNEKRLAVHVEDHPLSYADFEGVIPKGQYGGGTVIVWDQGIWTPVGDAKKAYRKGHMEFELDGKKLKGRWHLVRMKGKPDEKRENWLLIKAHDDQANEETDVTEEAETSVKTGRTIEEVEKNPIDTWNSKPVSSKAAKAKVVDKQPHDFPKGSRKAALPKFIKPALATLKKTAPSGERWLHEIKFDGYRTQARIDRGDVTLLTRSGLDWTEKFGPAVLQAFANLPLENAIIDGEIVVEKETGISDFSALQADLSDGRNDRFRYYAFDLLHLDGRDLQNAALRDRKALLEKLLPSNGAVLQYSTHFEDDGDRVLQHACDLGLEGVISKIATSPYTSGRHGEWIKSKCSSGQEFVVGGFTHSSSSDQAIGSLALGVYENGKLRHVGRVGTGFSVETAERLLEQLRSLEQKDSPFVNKLSSLARRGLRFVEPELVAQVEFRGWSGDGNLRHASFHGLREDKAPKDIRREEDTVTTGVKRESRIKFTHPDRIYWPDAGITKQGLADYYEAVWDHIEPYVTNRALSLVRCPEGIDGQRFFQKHPWRGMNKAIEAPKDPKDRQGEPLISIGDFEGMMALVQPAVLEIHPWGSSIKAWEKPDIITMDLDPGEDVPWSAAIDAAFTLKERMEASGLIAFVKTSGGKGLHVVAPLEPKAGWAKVKSYAKKLATDMAKGEPDKYLAVATKSKREGRIFIDYLRNGRGSTAVAPYSTRARPGATVSMPLDWSELRDLKGPAEFTIANTQKRISALKDDPWKDFFASAKPLSM